MKLKFDITAMLFCFVFPYLSLAQTMFQHGNTKQNNMAAILCFHFIFVGFDRAKSWLWFRWFDGPMQPL